jgi:DNA-binding NarL/FixJ family response regulator
VEGATALDTAARPLRAGLGQVVAISHDQLTVHRIAAALASSGAPAPKPYADIDEAAGALARNGIGVTVVVLGCDPSAPDCMADLRRLRKLARGARLVVISPATDVSGVRRALDAGADGVVFESELDDTLAPSLIAVAAGQVAVPRRLRGGLQKPVFSHREREVLGRVASGMTNRQIAETLFLAESTVKTHLSSVFAKLGVRSRKEAAALVLDPEFGIGADLHAAGVFTGASLPRPEAP